MRTAFRMEVEQVECVVLGLLTIERGDRRCTDLEFQHQDGALGEQNGVDPPSQTEQRIFEQDAPGAGQVAQCRPQQNDLLPPGVELRVAVQMMRLDQPHREAPHDRLGLARQQLSRIARPPRLHPPILATSPGPSVARQPCHCRQTR